MVILKAKEIIKISKEDREKKIQELKMELIKNKVSSSKQGSSKAREIKKIIARINTINNQKNNNLQSGHSLRKSHKIKGVKKE